MSSLINSEEVTTKLQKSSLKDTEEVEIFDTVDEAFTAVNTLTHESSKLTGEDSKIEDFQKGVAKIRKAAEIIGNTKAPYFKESGPSAIRLFEYVARLYHRKLGNIKEYIKCTIKVITLRSLFHDSSSNLSETCKLCDFINDNKDKLQPADYNYALFWCYYRLARTSWSPESQYYSKAYRLCNLPGCYIDQKDKLGVIERLRLFHLEKKEYDEASKLLEEGLAITNSLMQKENPDNYVNNMHKGMYRDLFLCKFVSITSNNPCDTSALEEMYEAMSKYHNKNFECDNYSKDLLQSYLNLFMAIPFNMHDLAYESSRYKCIIFEKLSDAYKVKCQSEPVDKEVPDA